MSRGSVEVLGVLLEEAEQHCCCTKMPPYEGQISQNHIVTAWCARPCPIGWGFVFLGEES
jgi:hypothetical protein